MEFKAFLVSSLLVSVIRAQRVNDCKYALDMVIAVDVSTNMNSQQQSLLNDFTTVLPGYLPVLPGSKVTYVLVADTGRTLYHGEMTGSKNLTISIPQDGIPEGNGINAQVIGDAIEDNFDMRQQSLRPEILWLVTNCNIDPPDDMVSIVGKKKTGILCLGAMSGPNKWEKVATNSDHVIEVRDNLKLRSALQMMQNRTCIDSLYRCDTDKYVASLNLPICDECKFECASIVMQKSLNCRTLCTFYKPSQLPEDDQKPSAEQSGEVPDAWLIAVSVIPSLLSIIGILIVLKCRPDLRHRLLCRSPKYNGKDTQAMQPDEDIEYQFVPRPTAVPAGSGAEAQAMLPRPTVEPSGSGAEADAMLPTEQQAIDIVRHVEKEGMVLDPEMNLVHDPQDTSRKYTADDLGVSLDEMDTDNNAD